MKMTKLKVLFALSAACLWLGAIPAIVSLAGCTTTQQTASYKTLSSVESAVTTAYDVYTGQVAQGKIGTNDVPKVSKQFNQVQASLTLAATLAQNSTNALAPDALVAEAAAFINIINQIKK